MNPTHYVYLVTDRQAGPLERSGVLPKSLVLKASRFPRLKRGDVIWMFYVFRTEQGEDTFVTGRVVTEKIDRHADGNLEVWGNVPGDVPLNIISLGGARLKIEFSSTEGSCFGFKSSCWGGGSTTIAGKKYPGFRTGWVINDMTVKKLEALWQSETQPAPKKPRKAAKKKKA